MKVNKIFKSGVLALSISTAMLAFSQANAEDDLRQVEHISWTKSGNSNFQPMDPTTLPANEINLIFVRPLDNDPVNTSANIAIDGRFHVSLQPGHYSQVRYCGGKHNISVAPTSLKTNDLNNAFSHIVDFEPQQNHYIYVDMDDQSGNPRLSKIDNDYALELMNGQFNQIHQVSRVVRNCPEIVEQPVVEVEIDKPINLRVLFEFDKAVIQPVFNERIEAVANFMKKYPETTTVLEGHTDSMGSDSYNMDLSNRRAEAVKQQLVTMYGIEPNRIQTQGFGETQPVDTNDTDAGRYNNRRVVATVSASQ